MTVREAAFFALAALASGCSLVVGKSIDPFQTVDFAGEYSLQVTNRENGCGFDNWREDQTTENLPLTITQDGDDLTGVLGGLWAVAADAILGNHRATGTATGSEMEMRLQGTRSLQIQGGCASFVVDAIMRGTLDGDFLVGTTTYEVVETNGSAACADLIGCETVQAFNGTRPPR